MLRIVYNKKFQRSLHGISSEVFDSGGKCTVIGYVFVVHFQKNFLCECSTYVLYGNMFESVKNEKWRMHMERGNAKKKGHKNSREYENVQKIRKKTEKVHAESYCHLAKKCGGCTYQGMEYKKQLAQKQKIVDKLLRPFGKVHPIVGMDKPYHYRNKVHAVFHKEKNGSVISGVYEEGSHRVVKVDSCLIEDEKADAIIVSIRDLLKSFKMQPYNEDTGYGLLRHVLVRVGKHSGQIMVVLVLGSPILPSKNNFVKALRKLHPEITTIVLNVNDKKTSMVLGERETVLYGNGYIEDTLCDYVFRISSKSFYQINVVQTEKLYQKAMELAALTGKERVIDAYCGIGTIGMVASAYAKEVIGVELNKEAVRDAIYNAKKNKVNNIRFYQNDAGKFMVGMAKAGETADVVIMDPPRAGSTEEFMSSVVILNPKRVVYISCNPETQIRDLKYFVAHGYKVEECWAYDLFPWTSHVETVCLLSKLHAD